MLGYCNAVLIFNIFNYSIYFCVMLCIDCFLDGKIFAIHESSKDIWCKWTFFELFHIEFFSFVARRQHCKCARHFLEFCFRKIYTYLYVSPICLQLLHTYLYSSVDTYLIIIIVFSYFITCRCFFNLFE